MPFLSAFCVVSTTASLFLSFSLELISLRIPWVALLQQALQGHLEPHHRFLLRETLAHLDFLQQRVGQLKQEVEKRLSPFKKSLALLMTIPGISRRSATILISELGTDMTAFPSAAHLASWVGLCPGSQPLCRQMSQWQADQRQPLPAFCSDPNCLGAYTHA